MANRLTIELPDSLYNRIMQEPKAKIEQLRMS
jgi:hypothetical protein